MITAATSQRTTRQRRYDIAPEGRFGQGSAM